jgi:hypothetical protein
VIDQITHPQLDPDPDTHLVEVDTSRPFAVWVQATGSGGFEVLARRPDDSLLTIIRGIDRTVALRVASRLRGAIDDDESWALNLVDVSAGKLRG